MRSRWLVILLALASGIAFAMSVQGGRWWVIGDAEVGPFGAKRCFDDGCVPTGLNWLGVDERWMRIGMGAWAGGLLSAFMLVVLAAGLAAKRIPRLVAKTVLVSIGTAVITGGMFAARFPRDEFPTSELGRGVFAFVAAIVLGVAAAVLVLRTKRPA
ncbi:MAG: hypothetical protein H0V17_09305 [Deltaproteobacteria bacterium]|nr:hypothetical protein [Deltaproteobacteria bacterium]